MIAEPNPASPPSADKRWRAVAATMQRYGHSRNCLIETLHTAQEAFGCLNDQVLKSVANALHLPLSKVYGVATFYHFFTLVPPSAHQCVICMGTACYVKGARAHRSAIERLSQSGDTAGPRIEVVRCIGTCGLAPLALVDDEVFGHLDRPEMVEQLKKRMQRDTR
ncbi:bidirectional hydrogenase complex protein HoxE [soil metagenome]